ncbi:hypothetical protein TeGR_g12740 [Tetraparma gracilis]|uniref:Inosine triphosphate pyrophosphatase n=1 Tax=Tetraparma gracilis TaxID=2962635 RepID=A0ABQ6MQN5_9STRA|nr:hypothetical protein TeGR_g12740 [Tetraparma gracilis]
MHLGLIPDGNSRHLLLHPSAAPYAPGVSAAELMLSHCSSLPVVESVSFFALSRDNALKRPGKLTGAATRAVLEACLRSLGEPLARPLALRFLGDLPLLDRTVAFPDLLSKSPLLDEHCAPRNITSVSDLCASLSTLSSPPPSSPSLPPLHILPHDLDLIIRPGHTRRLSSFCLYESAYAELRFPECLWPDFTPEMLDAVLEEFRGTERRFGGLGEEPKTGGEGKLERGEKPVAFVTGNKGKLEEVRSLLSDGVPGLVLTSLDADLPELQGDPAEIVREKCLAALGRAGGSPVIVEDTSLCFNALGGMPGPYVKWFLEAVGHAGLNKMLDGFEDRSAYARTVVGYCAGGADREVHVFEGRTDGCIVQPRGGGEGGGFGWDPVFECAEGDDRTIGVTYAEMDKVDKNRVSHRARAFGKLKVFLAGTRN